MTGPAPTHVVLRSFPSGGRQLTRGTKVDASRWLNAAKLEKGRFISRLPGSTFNAYESKVSAGQIRERRRAFAEALMKAQAELEHQAEDKRRAARSRSERALAEDLGKIRAELEAGIAAARERLQKEHGTS